MSGQRRKKSDVNIAKVVKEARKRAGLVQREVAEKMGWASDETVSSIERGDRALKADEVLALAALFRVPAAALLGLEPLPGRPLVLWRTDAGAPHGNLDVQRRRELDLYDRAQRYARLTTWVNEPAVSPLPQYTIDSRSLASPRARVLATQCRSAMNLGNVPGRILIETLERDYGVRVFFEDLGGDGDGSAATTMDKEFGPAILVNRAEPAWRRNFSVAHELFHLVTWDSIAAAWGEFEDGSTPPWYRALEQCANAFANAFLLPDEALREAFEQRTRGQLLLPHDAAQLALFYQVSLQVLAIRLETLGLICEETKHRMVKEEEYRQAWVEHSRGRADPRTGVFTDRFIQLVRTAFTRGEIGRAKAAAMLEAPISSLGEFGFDAPVVPDAEPAIC